MKKIFFLLFCLLTQALFSKPIEMVIGFGKGGATYKMASLVSKHLEEELNQEIKLVVKAGEGSLYAAKYILEEDEKKIKIFASTFSPYLANTIISKQAEYKLEDFSMLNLQWFDYDIFLVNKSFKYDDLLKLFDDVKNSKKALKVGVNFRSSGHDLIKELIKKYEIPKKNIKLNFYLGGKKTRDALLNKKIDLALLPAQGSELYRDKFKALSVVNKKRVKRWDTPTLNELLGKRNIFIKSSYASIRGFAVSSFFKNKYPNEYQKLKDAFKKVLAKKSLQKEFRKKQIGYIYLGEEKSNKILQEVYESLKLKNSSNN